jgi:hypothetical protein
MSKKNSKNVVAVALVDAVAAPASAPAVVPVVPMEVTPREITYAEADAILSAPAPVNVQVGAVTELLGECGETPAAPASSTPQPMFPTGGFNLSAAVREILSQNVDATRDEVLTYIEDTYDKRPESDFTSGTFSNVLSVMRKKIREGGTGEPTGKAKGNGTAHVATVDPIAALKLCQTLKMTPATLIATIGILQATGSIDAILRGLEALATLQAMMSEAKTV